MEYWLHLPVFAIFLHKFLVLLRHFNMKQFNFSENPHVY